MTALPAKWRGFETASIHKSVRAHRIQTAAIGIARMDIHALRHMRDDAHVIALVGSLKGRAGADGFAEQRTLSSDNKTPRAHGHPRTYYR